MRVAVVDIGTNSTRLLVAEVERGDVRELDRRTTVTRLGEGLEASGRLSDDAMARVSDALAGYRDAIDELRAERVVAVATSAMRDAANGPDFRAELERRFGIDARTISGDEEARLSFLGATAGRPAGAETLVVDIGGGSTEYVPGHPGAAPDFHVSTRNGLGAPHRAPPALRPAGGGRARGTGRRGALDRGNRRPGPGARAH